MDLRSSGLLDRPIRATLRFGRFQLCQWQSLERVQSDCLHPLADPPSFGRCLGRAEFDSKRRKRSMARRFAAFELARPALRGTPVDDRSSTQRSSQADLRAPRQPKKDQARLFAALGHLTGDLEWESVVCQQAHLVWRLLNVERVQHCAGRSKSHDHECPVVRLQPHLLDRRHHRPDGGPVRRHEFTLRDPVDTDSPNLQLALHPSSFPHLHR